MIQASAPRTATAWLADDESLCDAAEEVFVSNTEDMIIFWNHVPIALSYEYAVSLMVDDILDVATAMLQDSSGESTWTWPVQEFMATWTARWSADHVDIEAVWETVVGDVEALLAASGRVRLPVAEFLAEWKRPLEIVLDALRKAGYTELQIPRMAHLAEVIGRLPRAGQLCEEPVE